jgi:hypothetical protein
LGGDTGEALDIFVEIKPAIEAPLIAGEITLGVLRVARATRASDRTFDVAETRVRPLEAPVLRSPAAGHDCFVLEPGISEPAETAEAVAHDVRAGCNIGFRVDLDRLPGEPRNAPQLGVDRLVLTSGDGRRRVMFASLQHRAQHPDQSDLRRRLCIRAHGESGERSGRSQARSSWRAPADGRMGRSDQR